MNDNKTVYALPTSLITFDFPPAIPVDPVVADLLQAEEKEKGQVVLYDGADLDMKAIDDFEAKYGLFLEQSQRQNFGLLGA